jgi:nucleoside-diphosphate-sugar epimerase
MRDVVAAIERVVPEAQIRFDDVPLPFPEELESGALERAIGELPATPLEQGVRETIEHFRRFS